MSYQVLARKYRPRSFDALIGQEHIVRALTYAIEKQRLHHAYLFTGTRGVGKTTLSRILAKSLNCYGINGISNITTTPCGICDACIAIDNGYFIDYIEMDAASTRGVEEMTKLLEQAIYTPSYARFKIYMIDEVHMLTNHAFNAMLKTLEEPPAHIKFILATTDAQKIPVTVLSRCLQFSLKQISLKHIINHLNTILSAENIAFEKSALHLLAQGANGSMRDALSLTDQAIDCSTGNVTLQAVQNMFGVLDKLYLIRLLNALVEQNSNDLLNIADEIAMRSLSYNAVLQDLASLLHQIALAQIASDALAKDILHYEEIIQLSMKFSPEDIQLFYQIVIHGRNELNLAPDEYAGFSMTLLRMLAFKPMIADLIKNPTSCSTKLDEETILNEIHENNIQPLITSSSCITCSSSTLKLPFLSDKNSNIIKETVQKCQSSSKKKHVVKKSNLHNEIINLDYYYIVVQQLLYFKVLLTHFTSKFMTELNWDGNWLRLIANLPLNNILYQIIRKSELIQCERKKDIINFYLRFPSGKQCSISNIKKLSSALSSYFARTIHVKLKVNEICHDEYTHCIKLQQQFKIEKIIRNDQFIKTVVQEFDAFIVPQSIQLL